MSPTRFLLAGFALLCFVCARPTDTSGQPGLWTWVHGDSAYNVPARYGIRGVADSSNLPAGVYAPVFWTGKDGTFWLYGGKDVTSHYLSELWRFDPDTRMWTWMKGDSGLVDQPPTFGSKGVSAPTNSPGARGLGCPAWTDTSGNLWMFGGYAKQRTGSFPFRYMSDVWKYDIQTNEWTWMAGDSLPGARVLGTRGVPSTLNLPGQIAECSDAWTDPDNNFWFYGGGVDFYPDYVLWRFNPQTSEWTWMSGGTNFGNPLYGTRGVFDSQNLPGQRFAHTSWTGNDGMFWLLGGASEGLVYTDFLNDLWCYDPQTNQWAWYAGDNAISDVDHAGPLCEPADTVTPGNVIEARAAWTDADGNLWKYGGIYENPNNAYYYYQSLLWCFVMARKQWMLVESPLPDPANSLNIARRFGVLGQPDINSHPGSRCGTASFKDRNGRFYLFGGLCLRNGTGSEVVLNDFWSYEPDPSCLLLAGIDEATNATAEIVLFPNPAQDRVTIQQSDATPYNTVDLQDLQGKTLLHKSLQRDTELELNSLAPGIYLLQFSGSAGKRVERLVVGGW